MKKIFLLTVLSIGLSNSAMAAVSSYELLDADDSVEAACEEAAEEATKVLVHQCTLRYSKMISKKSRIKL